MQEIQIFVQIGDLTLPVEHSGLLLDGCRNFLRQVFDVDLRNDIPDHHKPFTIEVFELIVAQYSHSKAPS